MAYASLVSLANFLEQNLKQKFVPQNTQHIETLLKEATFLQDFLEKSSLKSSKLAKGLESRIRDACYKAQDILESQVVDRLLEDSLSGGERFTSLFQDLEKVIEEINSIKQVVMHIKKENNDENHYLQQRISLPPRSSRPPSHGMTTMIGLDDHFENIMTRLVGDSQQLEIVSLIGMGGIGKTTLAKKVYENKSVLSRFDIHGWATISQEYNMRNTLLDILDSMDKLTEAMRFESKEKLAEVLYKSIKHRRYFIVLDDLWDAQVWDDLRRIFPNDSNESRILLTTRLEKVGKYPNFSLPLHRVRFLNDEESWSLFCVTVFGRDSCPLELEDIGKEIVRNCRGLPLAIVVIGGLLSRITGTTIIGDYWRSIAKNLSETITSNDEQCSRVLSLSYNNLPHHLKGCFLYMRIFPEDFEIKVSRLLRLWIASGFIKQEGSKSFEDVAEEYFLDLVERNLILVSERNYDGKIKRCKIHDLIRDLCIKKAKNEMFSHITDKTLFHDYRYVEDYVGIAPESKLVRALYLYEWRDDPLPTVIDHLANLQFLFYHVVGSSFGGGLESKFRHLHTIDFKDSYGYDPITWNIWEMPQLRHIKIKPSLSFPNPPTTETVLENLETLTTVQNFVFTDEVLQRLPNLKELRYWGFDPSEEIDWREFGLYNLERLDKLESLKCCFHQRPVVLSRDITFPRSIKKLTLSLCRSSWDDMRVVGSLPNLEELKLDTNTFVGEEWETEDEFVNLKFLHLEALNLVYWRADAAHFPQLQHLSIHLCQQLKEIPSGFGGIPTLQYIEVVWCGKSVESSAMEIEEEQNEYGNETLQVVVYSYDE